MIDYEAVRFLWRPSEDFEWRYDQSKLAWQFGELITGPQFLPYGGSKFYPIMTIFDEFIANIHPAIECLPYQEALRTATKYLAQQARRASL